MDELEEMDSMDEDELISDDDEELSENGISLIEDPPEPPEGPDLFDDE
jgi:hypothetical protein